jgi:hypothetical protein
MTSREIDEVLRAMRTGRDVRVHELGFADTLGGQRQVSIYVDRDADAEEWSTTYTVSHDEAKRLIAAGARWVGQLRAVAR